MLVKQKVEAKGNSCCLFLAFYFNFFPSSYSKAEEEKQPQKSSAVECFGDRQQSEVVRLSLEHEIQLSHPEQVPILLGHASIFLQGGGP